MGNHTTHVITQFHHTFCVWNFLAFTRARLGYLGFVHPNERKLVLIWANDTASLELKISWLIGSCSVHRLTVLNHAPTDNFRFYDRADVLEVYLNNIKWKQHRTCSACFRNNISWPCLLIGTSFGTTMAISLARYNQNNDIKKTGLFGQPVACLFCSKDVRRTFDYRLVGL